MGQGDGCASRTLPLSVAGITSQCSGASSGLLPLLRSDLFSNRYEPRPVQNVFLRTPFLSEGDLRSDLDCSLVVKLKE